MPSTPLVLLHPFPFDASFWDTVRPALERDRPVLAPQAPGFGETPLEPGWSVDDLADRAAALIAQEAGGRAAVCGLSLGGYAALSLALRHAGAVAALVLVNTRAEADDAEGRAGRDRGVVTIRSQGTAPFLDGLLGRALSPGASPEVRERARAIADRQPGDAVVAALDALRDRPDRVAQLGRIAAPTLVIAGADDALIPAASAQVLAEGIPDARLETIAGAGHLSALERPGEFSALVSAFMSERVDGQ